MVRTGFRISFLLCGLLLAGCGSGPDPMALGQSMAKAVPLKSTPAQVLGYLSGEKIEHSEYMKNPIAGNSILATIYDSKWKWTHTNCLVIFSFDEHDRLIAADVREDHKGP
jgi:hypothetical protein